MNRIAQGSIESVVIDVNDVLEDLVELPAGTRYDVKTTDDATFKMTNAVPTIEGMRAICLIDTTTGGAWDKDEYAVWLRFTSGSESPRLGPHKIVVT